MSIGYACLSVGVPNTTIKGCLMKNADELRLTELIRHNLTSLQNIINYNAANEIRLFRLSSDVIAFGSSFVNTLKWRELFEQELFCLGESIKKAGIRISMHPGQYTVLNSPKESVAERAIEDLVYHCALLDSLGVDYTNKIIIHIGGVYENKKTALLRFSERYKQLDDSIKRRLVIENDDKSYHIEDVLKLGTHLKIPVVYDNLHNKLNSCNPQKDDLYWITLCTSTWRHGDGLQKVHYSQQNRLKNAGSHSDSISIDEFMLFYEGLGQNKPDIMLEVKDKNLSAIKCINCTKFKTIKTLELEWSRYKYAVLEKSPNDYRKIGELLKDKASYQAIDFYRFIEHAFTQKAVIGNSVNAALHIWGYFKNHASPKEKERFLMLLQKSQEKITSVNSLKRFLYMLAEKYNTDYLLNSYYFIY